MPTADNSPLPGRTDMGAGHPPEHLEQRYGRRPKTQISRTFFMWILGAATLVAAGFIIWILVLDSQRPGTKDVGFNLVSSSKITADFEVSKDPHDVVRCGVEALNENYAVVGYTETTIGHVEPELLSGRTSAHRVEIRTTNQANSAQVTSCWVVGQLPQD